jgi:hypothetical protein
VGQVSLDVRIDGHRLADATETRPIRLDPRTRAVITVDVQNSRTQPVDVRVIRLEGRVVGLTFFAFDTSVGMVVPAGGEASRRFALDLTGLDGQAIGLIGGSVKLLDQGRHVVASVPVVVDVSGSLLSVYGLFGLAVAFLTILSFLGALVGMARHRLPANRWRRALRFLTPGLGLGLVINFTLSATRVFVPRFGRWVSIVLLSAGVLFILGYLTPSPDGDEDEEGEKLLAMVGTPVTPAVGAGSSTAVEPPDDRLALAVASRPARPDETPPADPEPSEVPRREASAPVEQAQTTLLPKDDGAVPIP